MGLNMDEMYPSKWLRASDLSGKRVKLTIGSVGMEQFQDGTSKPCIHFPGKDKGLILNKTNATAIAGAYGPDTDGWLGKSIELFSMKVQGPSGLVDGLRVSIPEDVADRQPAAARQYHIGQKAAESELNDDIPF